MSAKDLMMKDAEYSTPQDHYFAHVQSKKELEMELDQAYDNIRQMNEMTIMSDLYDTPDAAFETEEIIKNVIEQRRVKTTQEIFNKITETDKLKLMEKYNMTEEQLMSEFKKEDVSNGLVERDSYDRKKSDRNILDGTSAKSVFGMSIGRTKRVAFNPDE